MAPNKVFVVSILLVILGLLLLISCSSEAISVAERHERWMARHGRVYKDSTEKEKRLKIFQENLGFVDKFNGVAYNNNRTFKLSGFNSPFADLTDSEFRRSRTLGFDVMSNLSTVISTFDESNDSSLFEYRSAKSVPDSVNWRKKGAVTRVRDQRNCGSCWAFSTVAAVEGLTKIKTGKITMLSVQQLIDCAGRHTAGCHGGSAAEAFDYIRRHGGLAAAWDYRYHARTSACNHHKASKQSAAIMIKGHARVAAADEEALRRAVAAQPVSAYVEASGMEFRFYSGGVFNGVCGTMLDHMIVIVGYGATEEGQEYWLVKNSWGRDWGEGGYMRIQRGRGFSLGKCGIAIFPSYPIA